MGAAVEEAAEVAGEGADVVAAAGDDAEAALAGEVMGEPIGFVEVDAGWGELEGFAAMGFEIGAFAVDALVAGGRGDLVVPAEEGLQGGVELRGARRSGGFALEDGATGGVAVVGFDAPADGGFVGLGGGVEVVEELGG